MESANRRIEWFDDARVGLCGEPETPAEQAVSDRQERNHVRYAKQLTRIYERDAALAIQIKELHRKRARLEKRRQEILNRPEAM